jgi:integrase
MLYKRSRKAGSPWWVRFTIKGREIRVTSGTTSKALAEEFERRLREQLWREIELGEVQHTWEEATERWLKEKAHKRSLVRDQQAFNAVDAYLCGKTIAEIDSDLLSSIRERLRENRAPGTVNRLMATVRGVLGACTRWGWIAHAPKIEAQHVEKHDPRCISREQFESLAGHLREHLSRMARFAVLTGLRWSNVSGLTWSMVDLERGTATIPGTKTKNRKAIPVPLSREALELLRNIYRLPRNAPLGEYVFKDHKDRSPIGSPKTAWRRACKRAGLPGLRFHDLRHSWAAWHTMSGTPAIVLKELGGWSSLSMVERYSALNPGHLSGWADNISLTNPGTQDVKSSEKHREK